MTGEKRQAEEPGNEKAAATIRVVRVVAGSNMIGNDGVPRRFFSVTLNRAAGDELGIVATAVDPERVVAGSQEPVAGKTTEAAAGLASRPTTGYRLPATIRIPAAGEPHPLLPGFVARPPEIHAVGLRHKGGATIANESPFYNVLVRYCRAEPATGYGLPATKATNGSRQ